MIGSPSPLFSRRIHDNSLTTRKETGMRSVMRHQYVKISKNKKGNGNPNILHTRDFILIDDISFFSDFDNFLQSEMMLKKNNAQLSVLSVLTKTPRKIINKIVDEKEKKINTIDNQSFESIVGRKKNLPQVPNSNTRPKPQNTVGSNKETLQKLFLQKKMKKSDAPYMNIGGKIMK